MFYNNKYLNIDYIYLFKLNKFLFLKVFSNIIYFNKVKASSHAQ